MSVAAQDYEMFPGVGTAHPKAVCSMRWLIRYIGWPSRV